MSLLPIVRANRLQTTRNIFKHSPIFRLLDTVQYDELGKYLTYSTQPNCIINKRIVTATQNLPVGATLTFNPYPVHTGYYTI